MSITLGLLGGPDVKRLKTQRHTVSKTHQARLFRLQAPAVKLMFQAV